MALRCVRSAVAFEVKFYLSVTLAFSATFPDHGTKNYRDDLTRFIVFCEINIGFVSPPTCREILFAMTSF